MNLNSLMASKNLTIVTKEMANETLGVTTEPSPEKSFKGYICAVVLDILKFNKHQCFIVLHIKIRGDWSFVSERPRPSKTPRGYGTVWKSFSLLINAIDSDVVETVTSETETWLKFRDETETLS